MVDVSDSELTQQIKALGDKQDWHPEFIPWYHMVGEKWLLSIVFQTHIGCHKCEHANTQNK